MVRSAAFAHLPAFAAVVEKDVLISEISPLVQELASDLQVHQTPVTFYFYLERSSFVSG